MNKRKGKKKQPVAERNYKDTLFRMIFREPEALLSLYNAVNDTDYTSPEKLRVVTLENAIYMSMKNDLAFVVDCRMSLYEQQASVNPNMPLRDLIYVAREYQGMVSSRSLYSMRQVKLPTPYFVVFYNGRERQPERKEMKLSEAYEVPVEEPALELKVLQLNISPGNNRRLMEKCPLLEQYSRYVERVQQYGVRMPLNEAVEHAVKECIREGILSEFLRRNRAEAIEVSIFEYDEERELELLRKEIREIAYEEGHEQGYEQGRKEILTELVCRKLRRGMEPEKIAQELEEDEENIRQLCEIAAAYAPEYDSSQVFKALMKV